MLRTLNVLLVDDDVIDRELFIDAMNLVGNNYEVAEAGNGQLALDYLRKTTIPPHLIILDLNMPVKDGRETLKELKEDPLLKSIPVCIMSTSGAHFDVQSAYEEGASLFLVKPLEFDKLIEMLTSLLTLFYKYVSFKKS